METTSLQQRRASVGLSQAAVGKALGWTQTRVSRFERITKDLSSPQAKQFLSTLDRLASKFSTKEPKPIGRRPKSPKPIKPRAAKMAEVTFVAVLRVPAETAAGVAVGKIAEITSAASASLPKGWEFSTSDINLR